MSQNYFTFGPLVPEHNTEFGGTNWGEDASATSLIKIKKKGKKLRQLGPSEILEQWKNK